ncbi:MAG: DUF4105 domain-containing protein [Pseudomonadota bacterium]
MRFASLRFVLCGLLFAAAAAAAPTTVPLPDVPVTLSAPTAVADSPGETLRLSLLTFAPGETYWARFGHNALLVENTVTGANAVYNYGMFDFFQKNFFLNFARGHMLYRLDVDTLDRTLRLYASEGRWVRQQVLNLDAAQRLQLAQFLDANARPENAEYRYDYFRDNCSTRVRDAIDRVIAGALARTLKAEPAKVTYRHEATRLMRPIPALAVGMDAIMGYRGDAPMTRWEQSFVPEVFMQAVDAQRVNGVPLVLQSRMLVADSGRFVAPSKPLDFWLYALSAGVLLALLLMRSGGRDSRWPFALLATPLLLLAGIGGLLMLAAWTLTEHWVMHANFSLVFFSPLALLLLPTAWRELLGKRHGQRGYPVAAFALRAWCGIALVGGLTGLFWQDNILAWSLFWVPVLWGLQSGLRRRM